MSINIVWTNTRHASSIAGMWKINDLISHETQRRSGGNLWSTKWRSSFLWLTYKLQHNLRIQNKYYTSITMSMPSSAQGSFRGSLLETTLMSLPSTLIVSLSTIFTSALKVPSIESYFNKWDAYICNCKLTSQKFDNFNDLQPTDNRILGICYFTHILDTTTVINHNDIKWRILPAMPAPEEVSADTSKTINCHLQFGHYFSLNRGWSCRLWKYKINLSRLKYGEYTKGTKCHISLH